MVSFEINLVTYENVLQESECIVMTREEVEVIIDQTESKYDSVDRIYDGLTILHKYTKDSKWSYSFCHDQVFAGPTNMDLDEMIVNMTVDDLTQLGELGWFIDEDSWSHT